MNISASQIIGDLVAMDYRTAAVFKANGIDFCCNGNRSIAEACTEAKLSTPTLLQQLQEVIEAPGQESHHFQTWPPTLLADYIEQVHHAYVRRKISEIIPYLNKITAVHGNNHPELKAVQQLFEESSEDLQEHMHKEETILFPFIRDANKPGDNGPTGATISNDRDASPIAMIHEEHDKEGERFRKIASLTNNYTTPPDGCNTYRVTLGLLREFEEDLHLHIHLENNILIPKILESGKEGNKTI
ncbi:iron-sulfur cluster repair di-iron protein [Flavihumibacter rivuli]|uniref:iron-sulfur cluster repair di-iron protein n=1 Tax=Flavihumibacter rivuli TaxID=2838156 RepID=UPI001BDE8C86|nr:iron-sulfur cluster repair di-iron protein [Flavihumibacter rivuli]ULQ58318.1 iron-sulfur cluster repair di-iron protein [Flavihumibacter rivuli]